MTRRNGLAVLASLIGFGVPAASAEPVRAVVELFTSQGCSSCPPADEVLAELATDSSIVALSLPVDYWDRLGWKDTFASPEYSERQRRYGATRGDGEVYTPQAVVNGRVHMNGASQSRITAAMGDDGARLAVPVTVRETGDTFEISVGTSKSSNAADAAVLVMPIYDHRSVAIGRGENASRKITYTNIVRDIIPAGRWTGTGQTYSIPRAKLKDADGVAVLVQLGSGAEPGPILGAAQIRR